MQYREPDVHNCRQKALYTSGRRPYSAAGHFLAVSTIYDVFGSWRRYGRAVVNAVVWPDGLAMPSLVASRFPHTDSNTMEFDLLYLFVARFLGSFVIERNGLLIVADCLSRAVAYSPTA